MKRILFLIHDLGPGGAEKVLVNLVNNMDKSKYDITVMTIFDVGVNKQFLAPQIHYKAIFPKMIPGNSHFLKFFSPVQLHRMFIKEHYDVEISYLEGPCARIVSGCTNQKTKKVCWIHIEMHNMKRIAKPFRSTREAVNCYGHFDKIVCVSKKVRECFKQVVGINVPMEILYNTNESEKIQELATEDVTECVFPNDKVKLIGVGKLLKSKGFDRILRVQKRLIEAGYQVSLYILGVGPEEKALRKFVKDNGMEENVFFLGYQTNPYKFVAKADLFVCASLAEGFSTATTEALIIGTPVCTVEVSGMKELLGEKNEYGIVTPNTEDDLYDGIKKHIDNKELHSYYRKQAVARGKEFTQNKTVGAVEESLLKLIESSTIKESIPTI